MSWFTINALVLAAVEGERNRRYAESTGLLKNGIIEPVPHVLDRCAVSRSGTWTGSTSTIAFVTR